ncbi:MAG: hypothetical protein JRI36_08665, partial [Deltaproteobacteria bacterium]|nr:hypothetical protein [Deltaproteobacteria bacterium]
MVQTRQKNQDLAGGLPPRWTLLLLVVVLLFSCLLTAPDLYAADVTLAWAPNREPDLAGYRVFARKSGEAYDFEQPAWEGWLTADAPWKTPVEDPQNPACTIPVDDNTTTCFVLRAFDESNNESEDSNEACWEAHNLPPVADAGEDQTVSEGATVTLDGFGSYDPDGTIESYTWVQIQTGGPPVVLAGADLHSATFTAPSVEGCGEALQFALTVTDNDGASSTDSVRVNVSNQNQAPVALAGPDREVYEWETVSLDASDSYDPDGPAVLYEWSQIAGPAVDLSDSASSTPAFTAPGVGSGGATLTFELEVTDECGLKDTEQVTVTVSDIPPVPVNLEISGPDSLDENSSVFYSATATFSDGSQKSVANDSTWSVSSDSYASIAQNGVLTTGEVPADQAVTITAVYTVNSVRITAEKTVTIKNVIFNFPPNPPDIIAPDSGPDEPVSLTPELNVSEFTDPDAGDTHLKTDWQISRAENDFSDTFLVFSSTDSHLTTIPVPEGVLDGQTRYFWRARFYDNHGAASGWSETGAFTTDQGPYIDDNQDGIPDDQECGPEVDLDGNGISDNAQDDIKSVMTVVGDTQAGVKAGPGVLEIGFVRSMDPSEFAYSEHAPNETPFGMLSFRLSLEPSSDTAEVRIFLSDPVPEGAI